MNNNEEIKDGDIKISISTPSGYSSKLSTKISNSQWWKINAIIDGDEENDNAKHLAKIKELEAKISEMYGVQYGMADWCQMSTDLEERNKSLTASLNETEGYLADKVAEIETHKATINKLKETMLEAYNTLDEGKALSILYKAINETK